MLAEAELPFVLRVVSPVTIHGPFSRFVAFRHLVSPEGANLTPALPRKPLWGIGSLKNGGRYNFPETFEVVYLAEDALTALAEVKLMLSGTSPESLRIRATPWVHISVDGVLLSVLDLTNPEIQMMLCTSNEELTGEWRFTQADGQEAPTQLLGRVAFESKRFDGIRFPSSKNPGRGFCIAVFPDRLVPGGRAFIAVYDPHGDLAQRLPPH